MNKTSNSIDQVKINDPERSGKAGSLKRRIIFKILTVLYILAVMFTVLIALDLLFNYVMLNPK